MITSVVVCVYSYSLTCQPFSVLYLLYRHACSTVEQVSCLSCYSAFSDTALDQQDVLHSLIMGMACPCKVLLAQNTHVHVLAWLTPLC